jgi:hypothetical protein
MLTAAARGSDAATVTAGIGLNLRACPSLDCQVYDVMPYGAWAAIVSGPDANGWYQVTYGGTTGYAFGAWLSDGGVEPQWAQGNDPVPTAAPAPAPSYGSGYQATVYAAAAAYGVSGDWLWAVHGCETGYTYRHDLWGPNGEYGPFQFHASTFATFASMSGIGGSLYDPWAQAYVTAWAFANGYSSHWVCA